MRSIISLLWVIIICCFSAQNIQAQSGGNDCVAALANPLTLPYTGTNLTNCGSVNDYDAINTTVCGSGLYFSGEDRIYVFTPTTSGNLFFRMSTTSMSPGMFLFDGCPDATPTCLASSEGFAGDRSFFFNVTAGQTYYLMIDSWSMPDCHPAYDLYIGPPLPPTNQDCLGAIPVCTNLYNQPNSFTGSGNIPNEIDNTTSCLGSGELNDVWYTFTVQASGLLNFSITPNQMTDDYDWALYDLTNADCEDIFTNPALEVSCNYSGTAGITGANGLGGAQNNLPVPVVAGQIFVLNVSNFSSTQFGYTLDFTNSTAAIFDNIPPTMDSIVGANPDCGNTIMRVRFSENILCNTVDPADFILNGPGGPYTITQVSSVSCSGNGSYDNEFTLVLGAPINGTGNFTLNLVGQVTDLCGNIAQLTSLPFQIPGYEPFAGPDRNICLGDTAHLMATGGVEFLWSPALGLSNINISNPIANPTVSTMYVVRITVPCPFAYVFDTVWVNVLLPPIVDAGIDTMACEGSGGVGLQATVSGGVTPYTYVWGPSNANLSDFNITNPVANPNVSTRFYFYAVGFNGCRSVTDSVWVEIHPLPIVNAGPDLEFCADAPGVFLQGQIVNPSGIYELQWRPSTGLFCDTCLVTYAQPNFTTAYTLRVRSLTTGCASDSTTLNTQSTALVIVKPRPIAYAGADTSICQLDSAQLYASFTGAGPVYGFAWAPPHGITQPSIVNPKASPAYTTEYYLVVSSNGCESIADTLQVTVRPVPIVTGGNTKNICAGDSVQLDAQVQSGIAQAYRWTPGAGLSDSMVLHPMASPLVTTTYTMRAFNGICPSLPADVLVVVHSIPVANISLDTTICAGGDSITLTANVIGGNPPYTMQWSPVSGLGNPLSISTKAYPVQTTMYYYSVSSGTGATRCVSVDSVLVTVLPEVIAQLEADTSIICPGETIQLQASGGVGNATYQWSPVSGLSSPGASQTFASPSITTEYTVQVSEGQCRDSAKWTVTVHPDPGAAFHMSQVQGCAPLQVVMGNTSANALSYTWDFGDGSAVSNEMNPRHTFTKSGSYQVKLMVRGVGGCADTVISALPVQVSDGLVVDFSSDPVSPAEIAGPEAEIRFTDRSQGANRWLWEFGDGAISTEQNPVYQYPTPGKYVVTLIASDGKGCEQKISKGPFHIFMPEFIVPNVFTPNGDGMNDVFRVEYTGNEQYRIQIYDRWGVKYFESYNQQQHWDGLDLNGRQSAEGTYYYNIQLGGKSYSGSVSLLR